MRKLEIEEKELQPYLKNDTLTGRVLALLEHQKVNWSTAKENYNVLYNLKKKEFVIDGSKIIIQNNPHRLINTTAKVDEESVENRDCFLCIENLPAEQGAVKYYKEYYILVNPYPIFDKHFTIIKTKHIEQSILKYLNDMLLLSRDLGEELAVFYNGPKCGASAPDHLHFQAVPKTSLPVYENFVLNNFSGARLLGENKKLKAELILSAERYFVKLTSNDSIEIMNMFSVIYSNLTKIRRSTEEPMMNLLSFFWGNIQPNCLQIGVGPVALRNCG